MPAKRKQMHQGNKGVRDPELVGVCLDTMDATALGEPDMPKEMESVVSVDEERQSIVLPRKYNTPSWY